MAASLAPLDAPDPHAAPQSEGMPPRPPGSGKHKRRRTWKWWLANAMIIAGVLVLAYPLGTWAYTWFEQRGLREQLAEENPGMAAILEDRGAIEGLISVTTTEAYTAEDAIADADAALDAAVEAARAEREREYRAQLAAFNAAADAFEERVGGKTGEPIGRIIIPGIGVDVIMLEGTDTGDLREGPGHWPETPFPGQGGNFVVSGHRTTYGAPFRKLDDLVEGDIIELALPYGIARYAVSRVIIVYPDEVEEVAQLGREQVSLAACHPFYSARQRIVAQGELVSFKVIEPVGSGS